MCSSDLEIREDEAGLHILPRDGFRKRVYIAPLGLWLTLDAGAFQKVVFDAKKNRLQVLLEPATATTPKAKLRMEEFLHGQHSVLEKPLPTERGASVVPLSAKPTVLHIKRG